MPDLYKPSRSLRQPGKKGKPTTYEVRRTIDTAQLRACTVATARYGGGKPEAALGITLTATGPPNSPQNTCLFCLRLESARRAHFFTTAGPPRVTLSRQ